MVTYGEMGSPPYANSDNPEEEFAEIDNGSAPHEVKPHVQQEADAQHGREAGAQHEREVEAEVVLDRDELGCREVNRADASDAGRC